MTCFRPHSLRRARRIPAVAAVAAVALALAAPSGVAAQSSATGGPRFEISFSKAAHAEPTPGRVYVAISRTNDASRTPIEQTGETGAPLFGVNIENLAPAQAAVIGAATFGHPVQSLRDIPAGEYWVQAVVNLYTKFARADAHTVWLHMDKWEGQHGKSSPGNIFGEPVKIT